MVFTVHFEQVNAGCIQNMYPPISSRLRNHILATTKSRKGFTLYEVEHQNNVDLVLVLCYLSSNFKVIPFASIPFATLSMYLLTG